MNIDTHDIAGPAALRNALIRVRRAVYGALDEMSPFHVSEECARGGAKAARRHVERMRDHLLAIEDAWRRTWNLLP